MQRESKAKTTNPNSFRSRVKDQRRDLVQLAESGVPELDFLPASDGMLVRGKRHLLAAPRKKGKSLVTLVHACRMCRHGATVLLLDRENGSREYAVRLKQIIDAWKLTDDERDDLRTRLIYVEHPRLRSSDGEILARWAARLGVDLVVFDAQRMFLTDLNLNEDGADDYSRFVAALVEPFARLDIATLILDNTGHNNTGRSRGSSTKGDLNEVLLTLEVEGSFSRTQSGSVVLRIAPGDSRFGQAGRWVMDIGGGDFGSFTSDGDIEVVSNSHDRARQLVLEYVTENPGCSRSNPVKKQKGKGLGEQKLLAALRSLLKDGSIVRDSGGRLRVPRADRHA